MTRIIGGRCRGQRIRVPSRGTRPTSDRVREALCSSVEAWLVRNDRTWSDLHVLDLYAGSGAVGLEAASRGAARVTLVESDARAFAILEHNCATLRASLDDDAMIRPLRGDARRCPADTPADLVFLDPPYSVPDSDVRDVLTSLVLGGNLADGALVVVERSAQSASPWPASWEPLSDRTYGDTRLWYGRHVGDRDADDEGRATGRSNA